MDHRTEWDTVIDVLELSALGEPTELRLIGSLIASILDKAKQVKYVNTVQQIAGVLTKGSFSQERWTHLLHCFGFNVASNTVLQTFYGTFVFSRQRVRATPVSKSRQNQSHPVDVVY